MEDTLDRFSFRAWHKKEKVMLSETLKGDVFRWWHDPQPLAIMQCTGLKDRNGKLIYDGDIVKGSIMDYAGNFAVFVYDGCFRIKADDNYFPCLGECCPSDYLKVIGNIYENPELLGKE